MTCRACIVVGPGEEALWARRADRERPMASATKMATAVVALEAIGRDHLRQRVRISSHAASTGAGGDVDLHSGERYSVEDLLYAALMASSNDAAVALAERAAGSEAAFVHKMNAYARELSLRHTHFVTAHGLDRPGHYSSASDLARIGADLLSHPLLARIVKKSHAVLETPEGRLELDNTNLLLKSYPGLIGIKTGYTAGAGNVLVAAAERSGVRVYAVALGSENAFGDDRKLLDYGFAYLNRQTGIRSGSAIGDVLLPLGQVVPVHSGASIKGLGVDLADVSIAVGGRPRAEVDSGERIGWVTADGGRLAPAVAGQGARQLPGRGSAMAAAALSKLLAFGARLCGRLGLHP